MTCAAVHRFMSFSLDRRKVVLLPQRLAMSAGESSLSQNQGAIVFASTNFQIIKGLIAVAMTDTSSPSIKLWSPLPRYVSLWLVFFGVGSRWRNVCPRHLGSCESLGESWRTGKSIESVAAVFKAQSFQKQEVSAWKLIQWRSNIEPLVIALRLIQLARGWWSWLMLNWSSF